MLVVTAAKWHLYKNIFFLLTIKTLFTWPIAQATAGQGHCDISIRGMLTIDWASALNHLCQHLTTAMEHYNLTFFKIIYTIYWGFAYNCGTCQIIVNYMINKKYDFNYTTNKCCNVPKLQICLCIALCRHERNQCYSSHNYK